MQNDGVPDGWDYVATPGWPYDQFRGEPPLVDLGHLKMPSHFTGIAVGKRSAPRSRCASAPTPSRACSWCPS